MAKMKFASKTFYEVRVCFDGLSIPVAEPFDNKADAQQEARNHHRQDGKPHYVLKVTKEVVYKIHK